MLFIWIQRAGPLFFGLSQTTLLSPLQYSIESTPIKNPASLELRRITSTMPISVWASLKMKNHYQHDRSDPSAFYH